MAIGNTCKENEVKNLIIRAWRERWTDSQWGIHIRGVLDDNEGSVSFISDAILAQALNGPGPNNLVLSYLKHSVFSHIISTTDVLKSVSQYTNFYKPFCLGSLLGLLEEIKDRVIRSEDGGGDSLDLALSLQSIIYWLLSVMYFSLEKISDMTDLSELSGEVEDSKIVTNCRKLLEFFLTDTFIKAFLYVASLEAPKVHENIQKMCRETLKFSDGLHSTDITTTNTLVECMRSLKEIGGGEESASATLFRSLDGKCLTGVNGAIQTTIMIAALLRTTNEVDLVANDLLIIQQLKFLSGVELYADVIHSGMIGLADAIGKDSELKFIGFTFLQLPVLLRRIREKIQWNGTMETGYELTKGLESFLLNESALDVIDSKLHCHSWDLFLSSLQKNELLDEQQKEEFLAKRTPSTFAQKKNSSNAVIMIKAEMTVLGVLKILDGDYLTQQDKIFTVISSMLGETFETFLIAASSTGLLQQVTARLIKLNQLSKQVNGESSKASTTRAVIFDSSFLALCHIMQNYGPEYLPDDEGDCFFADWYRESMGVEGEPKSPQGILAACDGKKVDLLLNQYLNSQDLDLKTSLVLWHEYIYNAVGVVSELLLAWGKDAVSFVDVKKVLDILRSKICALPVCIAAWLCSFIHVMPEEECGKARYILEHLMSPSASPPVSEEGQDNFKDRRRLMTKIMANMIQSTIHDTVPGSQLTTAPLSLTSIHDSKESQTLFDSAWTKRGNRGIMDVGTTLQMKNLLRISGPVHFVTLTAQRLLEIQHKVELGQWRDLAYGILHLDMEKTIPAFLNHLLPKILHLNRTEMNCAEPQGIALVSLAVDLTLSFYLHARGESEEGTEPPAKRRRMTTRAPPQAPEDERLEGRLELMLGNLFDHFHQILSRGNERSPSVRLIFRFLKEIALKTPGLSILHGLSQETVSCLISIMGDQLSPNLLLSFFPIKEKKQGRTNCAQAIARLKIMQDENEN